MELKEHTTPEKLLRYSFLWNEARLVIAAVSLLIGGFPVALKVAPYALYGMVGSLLTIAWIISGLAALYLLYRWNLGDRKIFGGEDQQDMIAFGVAIVSGLHLGLAGISGTNIGMSVIPSGLLSIVILLAGLLYLWAAYRLWKRWKEKGETIFSAPPAKPTGTLNTPPHAS